MTEVDLYALPPEEFTAARTAEVKAARQAGDAERAREIGALRKPTVEAWLANQLVRQRPDGIGRLLALGESLREATRTLDGAGLRKLAVQQQEMVNALVAQAREIAGRPVADGTAQKVAQTLQAALADPRTAAQLAAGDLTRALERGGFPSLTDQVTRTVRPAARTRVKEEKALRDAERDADRARGRVADLNEQLERATRDLAEAQARVDAARVALAEGM